MGRLDEIKARFDAEPDWGVYDGALCRQDLAAILDEFSALRADLARVTAERDAAVQGLQIHGECVDCAHRVPKTMRCPRRKGMSFCNCPDWQWRGPCVENGGTDGETRSD